jgi:transposase-like protein
MVVYQQSGANGSFLGAERSGAAKNDARPAPSSTEVSDKPVRRRFSASYKLAIVHEADRSTEYGQIGALLRREGLYHSHLDKWRKLRDSGALDALKPHQRGPKTSAPHHLTKENETLRRENTRLEKKLKKAEMVIDFQKKVAALLEMDSTNGEGSA